MKFLNANYLAIEEENRMPLFHQANDQNIHGIQMNSMKWLLPKSTVIALGWIWGIIGNEVINQKKCHAAKAALYPWRGCFLPWTYLHGKRFVSTGEPAAAPYLLVRVKVVENVLMQDAAAGSLCFATELHKMRHGGMGVWLHGCMGAWLHGCMEEKMKGRKVEVWKSGN